MGLVRNADSLVDVDAGALSSRASLSSSSPNTSTVFFHARSVMRSNVTSWFIRWRTHATPPTAHGSFLPLTAFPWTNLSGLVSGGKYSDRSDWGKVLMWSRDAWLAFIEHQGASTIDNRLEWER